MAAYIQVSKTRRLYIKTYIHVYLCNVCIYIFSLGNASILPPSRNHLNSSDNNRKGEASWCKSWQSDASYNSTDIHRTGNNDNQISLNFALEIIIQEPFLNW